jgi:hypothetical protein
MTTESTSIVQPHDYSDIIPDAEAYDGYAHSTDGPTLPRKLYNRKGVTASGVRITPDVFWDSVYDTVQPELRCIMVLAVRSRAWFKWSNAAKRNEFYCTSKDAITGVLEATGKSRKCGDTCPDTRWYKDEEGKLTVNCTDVRTVLCVDAERHEPFLLRFQKTSTKTLTQYMARHHDGRLRPKGSLKSYNLPLYAHHCLITLELSENGNYAVPVLTFGDRSTPEEAAMARETIIAMQPVLEAAVTDRSVDDDDSARADSGDTSFTPGEF